MIPQDIHAVDLARYLADHGWTVIPGLSDEDGYDIYEAPIQDDSGEPIQIAIPTFDDPGAVAEAIPRLSRLAAAIEQRPSNEVIADLSASRSDTLSIRIMPRHRHSKIHLKSAPVVYTAMYGLFAFAASAEAQVASRWEAHRAAFMRRLNRVGIEFAANLWLMPAEQKSFSFDVESVLPDDLALGGPGLLGSREVAARFRRQVMVRIVRGLVRCRRAYDNKRWENPYEEYIEGLNANMADALVDMYNGIGLADVDFSVRWSSMLREELPDDVRGVGVIHYTNDVVKLAYGLSRLLTKSQVNDEPRNVNIYGPIVSLKDKKESESEADRGDWKNDVIEPNHEAEFDADRVVTIETRDKGAPATVHFSLGESDYRSACNAHRDKRDVWARGLLQRKRGKWVLDPCEAFGLIGGSQTLFAFSSQPEPAELPPHSPEVGAADAGPESEKSDADENLEGYEIAVPDPGYTPDPDEE
ncbi:hypothetical protein [Sorangium sp. So ce426]|uniref:hypothetical protein n=1 Tax=Sorangium sp. So ce426 TaxID=3133312 RepID=UPI003F5BCEE6